MRYTFSTPNHNLMPSQTCYSASLNAACGLSNVNGVPGETIEYRSPPTLPARHLVLVSMFSVGTHTSPRTVALFPHGSQSVIIS